MAVAALAPLGERNVGDLGDSYLEYLMAKLLGKRGLFPFTELRVQVKPTRFRIPDVLAVQDYLEFGVENIWVVDPRRRRVTIETREGGRICGNTVETTDGRISIPLKEIVGNMPSTKEE